MHWVIRITVICCTRPQGRYREASMSSKYILLCSTSLLCITYYSWEEAGRVASTLTSPVALLRLTTNIVLKCGIPFYQIHSDMNIRCTHDCLFGSGSTSMYLSFRREYFTWSEALTRSMCRIQGEIPPAGRSSGVNPTRLAVLIRQHIMHSHSTRPFASCADCRPFRSWRGTFPDVL